MNRFPGQFPVAYRQSCVQLIPPVRLSSIPRFRKAIFDRDKTKENPKRLSPAIQPTPGYDLHRSTNLNPTRSVNHQPAPICFFNAGIPKFRSLFGQQRMGEEKWPVARALNRSFLPEPNSSGPLPNLLSRPFDGDDSWLLG